MQVGITYTISIFKTKPIRDTVAGISNFYMKYVVFKCSKKMPIFRDMPKFDSN